MVQKEARKTHHLRFATEIQLVPLIIIPSFFEDVRISFGNVMYNRKDCTLKSFFNPMTYDPKLLLFEE
ncbi:hypothetical protein ABD72_21645 [Brevibacillus laterosporus]|nr:hypothetical protein BrL25_23990 [Brevibacillus laterosporus DSM 25]MBG9804696.1 hypothetical protein [Brevibacillus laterosporus]TPH23096.1 hypothetical protein EGH09_00915 [Brevibacillus laterosporus]